MARGKIEPRKVLLGLAVKVAQAVDEANLPDQEMTALKHAAQEYIKKHFNLS